MTQTEFNNILKRYTEERKNGKDFSKIRKELKDKGLEEQEVNDICKQISDKEMYDELRKSENSKSLNMAGLGLVILLCGVGITIYTYFNGGSQYVLWYSAIIVGLGMFLSGLMKYKKR